MHFRQWFRRFPPVEPDDRSSGRFARRRRPGRRGGYRYPALTVGTPANRGCWVIGNGSPSTIHASHSPKRADEWLAIRPERTNDSGTSILSWEPQLRPTPGAGIRPLTAESEAGAIREGRRQSRSGKSV